ncbi:TPR-like protein [Nadsonia fulvescens var. elongata DSM 6958]|uniref:TPR-like protein n=1 Tax=Nadsonia fulvescens var. elongata DSM 6958 TaxID=857566 RepID=A0A1E3PMQ5_9ASCO|nr:TPR-like protein [Nadsonia fulvescens var. elongata DSM 6958]
MDPKKANSNNADLKKETDVTATPLSNLAGRRIGETPGLLSSQNPHSSTLTISPLAHGTKKPIPDRYDNTLTPQNAKYDAVDSPLSQAEKLRLWRHDAYMQHHYRTAEYIGDKILALTNDLNDAFWLAQVYYASGHYARAEQLLMNQELEKSVYCRYLSALCMTKMDKWLEALEKIGETNPFKDDNELGDKIKNQDGGIKLEASMCFLRGLIFANQNDFDRAKDSYIEAVKVDAKCFEAFDELIRNNLLTPEEEWKLLSSLDFEDSTEENSELVRALYTTRLGKYVHMDKFIDAESLLKEVYSLGSNGDVMLSRADLLFIQCRFKDCLQVCEKILEMDKFKFSVLPNYLACLYELGGRNKLFLMAHELTEKHPEEAVSWLATGIYYLAINKVAEARRFFSKASMMNPHFGQAWIGFAHTFAVEGEHEQAIAAYSTAARLFQGTHLPSLFLGMQHLQLNNVILAEEYLNLSCQICKTDPLLLNEMGVVYYHKNDLRTAEMYFIEALNAASILDNDPSAWLSIHANLGHVNRRLKKYEEALSFFEDVLRVSPRDSNIYSSMGLVNLQLGRLFDAIHNFHEALSLAPNDPVATDLLKRALEENAAVSFGQSETSFLFSGLDVTNDIILTTKTQPKLKLGKGAWNKANRHISSTPSRFYTEENDDDDDSTMDI